MKVSNKNASTYVNKKVEFQGSNTFGRYNGKIYAVYSYGFHFPMYVFKRGKWYGNSDKYSVSTSKHQTQLRPDKIDYWRNTQEMKSIHNY